MVAVDFFLQVNIFITVYEFFFQNLFISIFGGFMHIKAGPSKKRMLNLG